MNRQYVIKSKVKGHYEKRFGKIIYIHPYNTRRQKQNQLLKESKEQRVDKPDETKIITNQMINAIVYSLKELHQIPERELPNFKKFSNTCRSILKENGNLDKTFEFLLEIPDIVPKNISYNTEKVLIDIYRKFKGIKARTKNNNIRDNLSRLIFHLQEA